ncbi:MAG TPA: amidohydrolase family protein [Bordetella sp.]|nr:amidohydrolase family protein [Bordetella sp.]
MNTEPLIPSQEPQSRFAKLDFEVPDGACDTHAHIFGPTERYRLDPLRTFDPPRAGIDEYRGMLRTLGLQRAVIVHSAAYGTDISATRDALAAANGAWRGIALVSSEVTEQALADMHAVGFRGARFNLIYGTQTDLDGIEQVARRIADWGWHIQLLVDARRLCELLPFLAKLPVPVVFDHMGRMPTSASIHDPGFRALLGLLEQRRCWVKLSGANRMGDPTPPYASVVPFARALVACGADQLVWGSDWPHVREPGVIPNDGDLLNLLLEWVPDKAQRDAILADNPARLYGFGE